MHSQDDELEKEFEDIVGTDNAPKIDLGEELKQELEALQEQQKKKDEERFQEHGGESEAKQSGEQEKFYDPAQVKIYMVKQKMKRAKEDRLKKQRQEVENDSRRKALMLIEQKARDKAARSQKLAIKKFGDNYLKKRKPFSATKPQDDEFQVRQKKVKEYGKQIRKTRAKIHRIKSLQRANESPTKNRPNSAPARSIQRNSGLIKPKRTQEEILHSIMDEFSLETILREKDKQSESDSESILSSNGPITPTKEQSKPENNHKDEEASRTEEEILSQKSPVQPDPRNAELISQLRAAAVRLTHRVSQLSEYRQRKRVERKTPRPKFPQSPRTKIEIESLPEVPIPRPVLEDGRRSVSPPAPRRSKTTYSHRSPASSPKHSPKMSPRQAWEEQYSSPESQEVDTKKLAIVEQHRKLQERIEKQQQLLEKQELEIQKQRELEQRRKFEQQLSKQKQIQEDLAKLSEEKKSTRTEHIPLTPNQNVGQDIGTQQLGTVSVSLKKGKSSKSPSKRKKRSKSAKKHKQKQKKPKKSKKVQIPRVNLIQEQQKQQERIEMLQREIIQDSLVQPSPFSQDLKKPIEPRISMSYGNEIEDDVDIFERKKATAKDAFNLISILAQQKEEAEKAKKKAIRMALEKKKAKLEPFKSQAMEENDQSLSEDFNLKSEESFVDSLKRASPVGTRPIQKLREDQWKELLSISRDIRKRHEDAARQLKEKPRSDSNTEFNTDSPLDNSMAAKKESVILEKTKIRHEVENITSSFEKETVTKEQSLKSETLDPRFSPESLEKRFKSAFHAFENAQESRLKIELLEKYKLTAKANQETVSLSQLLKHQESIIAQQKDEIQNYQHKVDVLQEKLNTLSVRSVEKFERKKSDSEIDMLDADIKRANNARNQFLKVVELLKEKDNVNLQAILEREIHINEQFDDLLFDLNNKKKVLTESIKLREAMFTVQNERQKDLEDIFETFKERYSRIQKGNDYDSLSILEFESKSLLPDAKESQYIQLEYQKLHEENARLLELQRKRESTRSLIEKRLEVEKQKNEDLKNITDEYEKEQSDLGRLEEDLKLLEEENFKMMQKVQASKEKKKKLQQKLEKVKKDIQSKKDDIQREEEIAKEDANSLNDEDLSTSPTETTKFDAELLHESLDQVFDYNASVDGEDENIESPLHIEVGKRNFSKTPTDTPLFMNNLLDDAFSEQNIESMRSNLRRESLIPNPEDLSKEYIPDPLDLLHEKKANSLLEESSTEQKKNDLLDESLEHVEQLSQDQSIKELTDDDVNVSLEKSLKEDDIEDVAQDAVEDIEKSVDELEDTDVVEDLVDDIVEDSFEESPQKSELNNDHVSDSDILDHNQSIDDVEENYEDVEENRIDSGDVTNEKSIQKQEGISEVPVIDETVEKKKDMIDSLIESLVEKTVNKTVEDAMKTNQLKVQSINLERSFQQEIIEKEFEAKEKTTDDEVDNLQEHFEPSEAEKKLQEEIAAQKRLEEEAFRKQQEKELARKNQRLSEEEEERQRIEEDLQNEPDVVLMENDEFDKSLESSIDDIQIDIENGSPVSKKSQSDSEKASSLSGLPPIAQKQPILVKDSLEYLTEYVTSVITEANLENVDMSSNGPVPHLTDQFFVEKEKSSSNPEEQQIVNKMLFDCINEAISDFNGRLYKAEKEKSFYGHIFQKRTNKTSTASTILGRSHEETKTLPSINENNLLKFILAKLTNSFLLSQSEPSDFALMEMLSASNSHNPETLQWNNFDEELEEVKIMIAQKVENMILQDTATELIRLDNAQTSQG